MGFYQFIQVLTANSTPFLQVKTYALYDVRPFSQIIFEIRGQGTIFKDTETRSIGRNLNIQMAEISQLPRYEFSSNIVIWFELNCLLIHQFRHKLLDLEGDVVKAEIPETYKVPLVGSSSTFHLASLPANRGPFLCPTGPGNPQMQVCRILYISWFHTNEGL